MKKTACFIIVAVLSVVAVLITLLSGCEMNGTQQDTENTLNVVADIQSNQPTPTDLEYSLERYNLIKRAYWVNGQREKAGSLPCEIERPLGYIVLLTDNGGVVGRFIVDGKVSSLNSYLTPDSEYYEYTPSSYGYNDWIADVDGSYGVNDNGIFFFSTSGNYIEWTGTYLYSDIPFEIDDPIVTYKEANNE